MAARQRGQLNVATKQAMVEAAVQRWGRLDICVANAAIGVGRMFHRQPAAFGRSLAFNDLMDGEELR